MRTVVVEDELVVKSGWYWPIDGCQPAENERKLHVRFGGNHNEQW